MSDTVNLLAFGTEIIGSPDTSGSSGGGHTIEDISGTAVEQRPVMQFTDAGVTDNDTDEVTEVSVVRSMGYQEYSQLSNDELKGVIEINDLNPLYLPAENAVSVTADGVKTNAQLLAQLYSLVDSDRITRNSKLVMSLSAGDAFYNIERHYSTALTFVRARNTASDYIVETLWLGASSSASASYLASTGASSTTFTDNSSTVPASGTIFTLYYNILPSVEVEEEFVVERKATTDITIAANSFGLSTTDVSKAGYKPVGIVGLYGSNGYACPVRQYISGNSVYIHFYNLASSALSTVSPYVDILYKKQV